MRPAQSFGTISRQVSSSQFFIQLTLTDFYTSSANLTQKRSRRRSFLQDEEQLVLFVTLYLWCLPSSCWAEISLYIMGPPGAQTLAGIMQWF
jgi:hypothetical protein